jgi:hypothetical protein
VRISDGIGTGTPAIRYHLARGYDENNDGNDDLKLDVSIADLQAVSNLTGSSNTLRVTGYMKKGNQHFQGSQKITFVP